MTLRFETLRDEILAFLKAAEDLKDPEDQQRHFATELARAVDRFVRGGDVVDVRVDISGIGTAHQTGKGRVT
jgi:hypothetical protein